MRNGITPRYSLGPVHDAYDCARCLNEDIDPIDLQCFKVTTTYVRDGFSQTVTEDVCRDCIHQCPCCGEYIDDSTRIYGVPVRYRQWECDGRLSEPCHASCAANHLLGTWLGEGYFEADFEARERIHSIVTHEFWHGVAA